MQYAIEVLRVKHVIVCGHYGCGGVIASMDDEPRGLIDNWLRHLKDVYRFHKEKVDAVTDQNEKFNLMCELNVIEQVANVANSSIVKKAWANGQELTVHGFVYNLKDGILKDMEVSVDGK